MNHNINLQGKYEWKPEYLPLYRGLVKKKETEPLTKDETALVRWLAYSLADWTLKG